MGGNYGILGFRHYFEYGNIGCQVSKGQLISKCPFGVIISTKIPTKKFDNFCPRNLKIFAPESKEL